MKDKKARTLNGVAGTASSAAICKWSLCQKGYLPPDKYAAALAGHADGATKGVSAQSPLINHCYFHRALVTRALIQRFLATQAQQQCRVVFLGAGLDSLPLLLATGEYQLLHGDSDTSAAPFTYPTPQVVSVDLPEVVSTRASLLSSAGLSPSPSVEASGCSCSCVCVAADLRDLPSLSQALHTALPPTDDAVPTLFVLESVLGYLQPHEAQGLLRWAAARCVGVSGCLVLDLLHIEGAVGEGVREAFTARGCGLTGLPQWEDSGQACRVMRGQGWGHVWAVTLGTAVRGLGGRGGEEEAFDEHAALHTFHRHYVVALGWRGPASLLHTITQPLSQPNEQKGEGQSGLLMWLASLEARVSGCEGEDRGEVRVREIGREEEGAWAQVRTLVLQGYAPLAAQSSAVLRMARGAVEGDLDEEKGGWGQGGMWVAEEGGRVQGCVGLQVRGEVGEVKRLAVGKGQRRRGLGAMLLKRVEEEARGRGVREMVAVTVEGMEAARRLYAGQGYVCMGPPAKRALDSLWTFTKTL